MAREAADVPKDYYRAVGKRMVDLLVSASILLPLLPVMALVSVMVARRLGRPILFRQPRLGLNGRVFHIYKFRSLTDERDEQGRLLPDDQRLTEFGRKLRSTSLDELPQLLNVFLGDMSLIGPRPLVVRYRDRYDAEQFRRHDVRPGITGLTQVRGRANQTWADSFRIDVEYVDNVSPLMDLKIILLTVKTVLFRDGMERPRGESYEFWGTQTPPEGLDIYAAQPTDPSGY